MKIELKNVFIRIVLMVTFLVFAMLEYRMASV